MMFTCPELEKLPGQEAILQALTDPKTFNAGRYDQNGQAYNYFFQLFTRQRQTNYLHSNNQVKKLLSTKAQSGTYQTNSALLSTSYGISLTDNSGTSAYSFYHNYTSPADHYSGLYWTVFTETGIIIAKPLKTSASVNRGIVFDDQIISRVQNGLTSYHYQGETGYDYTIAADVSRVTPATIDSTLKGFALNKYRSSTDIIEFSSGLDIQPVDYVQYLGNNYIVLSRKAGLNNYNIFTAVLESNNSYTFSGANINPRTAPAALIDVNTGSFGTIPSTAGNVQQALDWIDDNIGGVGTTGNLTADAPAYFDNTRQVIGGAAKITLKNDAAAALTSFSTDGTLAGNTDTDIPTEKAVKTYVDGKTGTPQIIWVREEQSSGTNGGTFTSGSYGARVLNTSKVNTITGASLGSNQITLPAGTYEIFATAPGYQCNTHKACLYNVTDSSYMIIGTHTRSGSSTTIQTHSIVQGRFTIASQKAFSIYHRCETTSNTVGKGYSANFGDVEVYCEVFIKKV